MECRRLAEAIPRQDIAAEFIGRRPSGSRVPSPAMLDLERAIEVIGRADDARALARYMSFDGVAAASRSVVSVQVARAARHDPVPVTTLPLPTEQCDCLGFRLGGTTYCTHQRQSSVA
jgi:hypothetical protein